MSNSGVYPIDPLTPVGQFRLTSGDVISVPFDPVQSGLQNYRLWSDDEIESFLVSGGDSMNKAIGYAWLQSSALASQQSKTVKDYDLAVDLTKRATDLRKTAEFYFGLAAQEDSIAGLDDAFEIVDTGTDRDYVDRIEGFPYWPGLRS